MHRLRCPPLTSRLSTMLLIHAKIRCPTPHPTHHTPRIRQRQLTRRLPTNLTRMDTPTTTTQRSPQQPRHLRRTEPPQRRGNFSPERILHSVAPVDQSRQLRRDSGIKRRRDQRGLDEQRVQHQTEEEFRGCRLVDHGEEDVEGRGEVQ